MDVVGELGPRQRPRRHEDAVPRAVGYGDAPAGAGPRQDCSAAWLSDGVVPVREARTGTGRSTRCPRSTRSRAPRPGEVGRGAAGAAPAHPGARRRRSGEGPPAVRRQAGGDCPCDPPPVALSARTVARVRDPAARRRDHRRGDARARYPRLPGAGGRGRSGRRARGGHRGATGRCARPSTSTSSPRRRWRSSPSWRSPTTRRPGWGGAGRNLGRRYPPVRPRRFVGTADIVTVSTADVLVADFKTGHGLLAPGDAQRSSSGSWARGGAALRPPAAPGRAHPHRRGRDAVLRLGGLRRHRAGRDRGGAGGSRPAARPGRRISWTSASHRRSPSGSTAGGAPR